MQKHILPSEINAILDREMTTTKTYYRWMPPTQAWNMTFVHHEGLANVIYRVTHRW
jgi:hypothetical protein